MNTYCMIYELKPEFIEEYINLHQNCPDYQINALKDAGAENLEIYIYNNFCIITYELKVSFSVFLNILGQSPDNSRWQKMVDGMFSKKPVITGEDQIQSLKKIFSLKQLL
jgi:L-rhamnose mutarotase